MPLVLLFAALAAVPPVFPSADVQRGQKGECQTIFEGTTIEPMAFEVKGLMKNYLGPNRDLVLVKLLGDKPTFSGVVAGMSGSPCSIDGKLLGALAYSFATFAKEPIAGITPITSMTDVLRLPEEKRPWRIARRDAEADWVAMRDGTPLAAGKGERSFMSAASHGDGPTPIATPLMMSGFPPTVLQQFEPWLRSVGFEPVASGSAGHSEKTKPVPLVPGGSVAAVLISGDMDVAATGTVTWVDGDQVLAFGHPFFGAGAVSIPMANTDILNTMVSAQRSFKMAATGPIVGELTQDRLTAIAGVMGSHASLIPVLGHVTTPLGKSQFALDVARDLVMTPRMVAMGLAGALSGRVDANERGTVRMKAEITVEGQASIPLRNVYSSSRDSGLMTNAAIDVARAVAALWDTPFGPPPKISVSLDAELDPEPIAEQIEAISLDRPRVHPGEKLDVAVRLRRIDGPITTEHFQVTVPRSWAGQTVEVVAAGVDGAEKLEQEVNGMPQPTQYAQIGRYLRARRGDGSVYLMAVRQGVGLHSDVDAYSFIPPSAVTLLSGTPTQQSRDKGLAWEEKRERPGVVGGVAFSAVHVLGY